MRIEIDRTACVLHARCDTLAPEMYDDDESVSVVRITEVQPEHLGAARRGALAVPEMAITVDE